jgi:hypothetical protein
MKNQKTKKYLTKTRRMKRTVKKGIVLLTAVLTSMILIGHYETKVMAYDTADITVPAKKVVAPEIEMKEWIKQEIEKAGLKWEDVDCLIQNESGWNNYSYNVNWNNKTTDTGLWMINSVHKKTISYEDRLDYKKSTAWAIAKIKHDGNYSAWYGYLNNCIK